MDPALALEIEAESRSRGAIHAALQSEESRVRQMYAGTAVLVTGGSGFLGKQLIEKLLRSCDVKQIYVLLRTKGGRTASQRLEKLLKEPLFDVISKLKPDFRELVTPIEGDVSQLKLGISSEDLEVMTREVNVIFHGAATVNFSSPLQDAIITNVRGTREIIRLARECCNLKCLVYTSTAFSHVTRANIGQDVTEQFNRCPLPPHALIELAEALDKNVLYNITTQLIQEWPNTYSFSKAVAEEVIRTMASDLPVCIVRPAVVFFAHLEPSPGWCDLTSIFGPVGFLIAIGIGVIHVSLASKDINCHFVPVDYVSNATIAAAWETTESRAQGEKEIKIYTLASDRNPFTYGQLHVLNAKLIREKFASPKTVWYPFLVMVNNSKLFSVWTFFLHYVPAFFIDVICLTIGKPRIALKLSKKTKKLCSALHFFASNNWHLKDDNIVALQDNMSPADRILYNFDTSKINWSEYLLLCTVGSRKYIVKDGLKDTGYARKKIVWLRILHYIFSVFYVYVWWKVLGFIISISYSAWF